MVVSLPSDAICSGSRGTRTHNSPMANTCFRDRPLIRPDDFLVLETPIRLSELRGLESNQRPPDSESGVTTSSNCPAFQLDYRLRPSSSLIARRPLLVVRGEGFEPSSPASKAGSLPLADPRASLSSALRELNPPRRLGRPAPLPLGRVVLAACFQDRSLIRPDGFRRSTHTATLLMPQLRRQESNLRQGG